MGVRRRQQALRLRRSGAETPRCAAPLRSTPDRLLFKKIDSTLRGQPAAEIAATAARPCRNSAGPRSASSRRHFQRWGARTRDGHVFVRGEPLEARKPGGANTAYANADLGDILASARAAADQGAASPMRAGDQRAAERIARDRCRARQHSQAPSSSAMPRTTTISTASPRPRSGSAATGLRHRHGGPRARARAQHSAAAARASSSSRQRHAGALIVVGSLAQRLARGCAQAGGRVSMWASQRIEPDVAGADRSTVLPSAMSAISDHGARSIAGTDVVVELELVEGAPDLPLDPRLVTHLAGIARGAMKAMGGLIVTRWRDRRGTARARPGSTASDLLDEIEPGVALGMTRGEVQVSGRDQGRAASAMQAA